MITSTVYRKPTHTNCYLHYKSHHPTHVKRGVVRSLGNMQEYLKQEEQHLHQILANNGYYETIIKAGSTAPTKNNTIVSQQERPPNCFCSLCIRTQRSEEIRHVCKKFNDRLQVREDCQSTATKKIISSNHELFRSLQHSIQLW